MGYIYSLCCKKCRYKLDIMFGVGRMYPKVYEQTRNAALNGELGSEIQKFLLDNPDGRISVSRVLGKCGSCGQYEVVPDLTMYLPDKNIPARKSWYLPEWQLGEYYKVFAKYPHKCRKCGGAQEIFTDKDLEERAEELKCPSCNAEMTAKFRGFWD